MEHVEWQPITWSDGGGNCVELGHVVDAHGEVTGLRVRNSNTPDGPAVPFTRSEWSAFLRGVRAGMGDLPA